MRNTVLCAAVVILGCGFVAAQQYKVVWNFSGGANDGEFPLAPLIADHAGNLYGTTLGGGNSFGGTVFELTPNGDGTWSEAILYGFCANKAGVQCLDGESPEAGLVMDSAGNLYGTTKNGGEPSCPSDLTGCGVAFEISPPSSPGGAWTETVLHSFCSNVVNRFCLDGMYPVSQLTLDLSGNVYGTTSVGGTGRFDGGTVFELSPSAGGWTETVLYNFCSLGQGNFCLDGTFPLAGATFGKDGNLYGTTGIGGSQLSEGGGTVYRLSRGSNGWTEKVLFAFHPPGRNGGGPSGSVSFDRAGNLYSTVGGGGQYGFGGVFRLSPQGGGSEQTYSFNGNDGDTPLAGVLIDPSRDALYGTTAGGFEEFGSVFQMTPPEQETVLYNFCQQPNCTDGFNPVAGLVEDASGNLYGTTKLGGANNQGVVFEIVQSSPKQPAP
jgi:uncharacterized repeat protein (TIGR03803 family)